MSAQYCFVIILSKLKCVSPGTIIHIIVKKCCLLKLNNFIVLGISMSLEQKTNFSYEGQSVFEIYVLVLLSNTLVSFICIYFYDG